MKNVQIIQGKPHHANLFPECLALVDRTQGKGIFSLDYFDRCASQGDRFLLLALLQESLVGVASARVLPADGFAYYSRFGKDATDLFHHHQVGSLETASVLESMRGRGIGQALAHRRIQWLREMGCSAIIGIAWESGLPHTSHRVFTKLGLQPLSRVADFYHDQSLQHPFICPVCGPPPCHCSATLFVKLFTSHPPATMASPSPGRTA